MRRVRGINHNSVEKINRSMTLEKLKGMRTLERKHYRKTVRHLSCSSSTLGSDKIDLPLYFEWRAAMIGWSLNIANTCGFELDTVEVALSILDRFVAQSPKQRDLMSDPKHYQLAAMTSLAISAKVHESESITSQQLEKLSAGRFFVDDIDAMEMEMLFTLRWLVNPPTVSSYCRTLLELLPLQGARTEILEVVESHIERAMTEEYFLRVKTSSLAASSLQMAIQECMTREPAFTEDFDPMHMDGLEKKIRCLLIESFDKCDSLNHVISTISGKRNQTPKSLVRSKSVDCRRGGRSPRCVSESFLQIDVR